jgi:hypothetical protein
MYSSVVFVKGRIGWGRGGGYMYIEEEFVVIVVEVLFAFGEHDIDNIRVPCGTYC